LHHVLTIVVLQEISELLANKMSNQDEDEVEDELAALEAEVSGITLPDAPANAIELSEEQKAELSKERARRRAKERAAERAAQPMLA
jgi:charged multivesicular body protein 6